MAYEPFPRLPSPSFHPIDFSEGIASLGNLIDSLSQRRMKQAADEAVQDRADQELALKQQDRATAQGRESRIEQQNLRQFGAGVMEKNRQEVQRNRDKVARGGSPEALLWTDPQGNASYIQPEDATAPTEAPAPPAEPGPEDINSILAGAGSQPAPDTQAAPQFKPEPELDALMGQAAPAPTSQSVTVPPTQVRGASYQAMPEVASVENMTEAMEPPPAAPASKRWQYRVPGQDPIVLDQGKARDDLRGQREMEAEGIRQQLENPNLEPAQRAFLEQRLSNTLAGTPAKMQIAQMTETGKKERAQSRMDEVEAKIASQEKIAEMRSKKHGKYGSSGLGPGGASQGGSAWERLVGPNPSPATFLKAERAATMVDSRINRTLSQINWTNLEGKGVNRLDLANDRISDTGANSATSHFEAMMNFFGYVRGGVPAKNETDQFYHLTGNIVTWANSFGQAMKLGMLGTRLIQNSGNLSDDDLKALEGASTRMSPEQIDGLKNAIRASQAKLRDYSDNACKTIYSQFAHGNPIEKELAQAKIDALATYARIKSPYNLVDWSKTTKPAAPGAKPAPAKESIFDRLDTLEGGGL